MSTNQLAFLILNGLALSMLYILIASGFAVIFGITDVLNFAHGVFYMLGAYLGVVVMGATGRGGLPRRLLGSTTDYVVTHADVPVHVVPTVEA